MSLAQGSSGKTDLNVELNLLPVFDILSVCICFLLMTVVWIEVRSIQTSQSIGGQSASETASKPSIWFTIDESNNFELSFKQDKKEDMKSQVKNSNGNVDWKALEMTINSSVPMGVEMAHILPSKTTKYDNIIKLMDLLKQRGIKDIGLSPL